MNPILDGNVSIYSDCIEVLQARPQLGQVDACNVAKCFLTNAKKTCEALLRGRLTLLDPIVGENACQIRALAALKGYIDPELKQEATAVLEVVQKRLQHLNGIVNKQPQAHSLFNMELRQPLEEQLQRLGLGLAVSQKLDFLIRTHFLTVGKYFFMNRNGEEKSGIECERIRRTLKTGLALEFLQAVVPHSQSKISHQSIRFLQAEALNLPGSIRGRLEDKHIKEIILNHRPMKSSCAFYNVKALLMRVEVLGLPIMLKEHGVKNPQRFLFVKGVHVIMPKPPEEAVLVVEGFFKEGMVNLLPEIQRIGLQRLLLANVACVPQYSAHDDISGLDPEAQEEIGNLRTIGELLGCQTPQPRLFSVAHIHAATLQEEKER